MTFGYTSDIKHLVHPYIFVLKEGKKITKNLLDYELLMLQTTCPEIIKSPSNLQAKPLAIPELERVKNSLSEALFLNPALGK